MIARICFLIFMSLSSVSAALAQKASAAKQNQPINEPITINYSGLQKGSPNQFFMVFLFGNGGDFHDSKNISLLPAGSVQLKPITKAGIYNIVVYSYTDISDSKPRSLIRTSFRGVNPTPPEIKKQAQPADSMVVRRPKTEPASPAPLPVIEPGELQTEFSLSSSKLQVDEPILIHYQFRPVSKADYYNISISRPGEKYLANISSDFTNLSGSVTLKPIYQPGIYELQVHETRSQKTEIVYRQPVVVGEVDKNFTGRYSCTGSSPAVNGKAVNGAPGVNDIIRVFQTRFPVQGLEPWIRQEDICIEYGGIRYLPVRSAKIKKSPASKPVLVSSFPVNLTYKIVVNDFYKKQTTVKEETKLFYFYKTGGTWDFQRS